jgi:translation initiation factor IF-2
MAELQAEEEEPEPGHVAPLPELAKRPTGERPESAVAVPPVVTVLGHVDHGKTSLLDALRSTDIVAGESGGITQHIGASEIDYEGQNIVFIDTPGHEAFTAMRARGAQITDIAILIIAADDGIMPQTIEALNHAKAADVPIVVAINKCDLPTANPERVKQQLLEHELVPEEWGGDTIVCEISAETGDGLNELVEMLLLVAEVQELWGDPEADFVGVVIESGVATSQGAVASLLVRAGTLTVGDSIVVGTNHGRIRRLNDWRGKSVKSMEVGRPVEIVGLSGPPEAGEIALSAESAKEARAVAEDRAETERERDLETSKAAALRELFAGMRDGEVKQLNLIIKADVFGSGQALAAKFLELDQRVDEIDIDIVHTAVGPVNESDVMLARASEAIIIAFRADTSGSARQTAESEGIEIRSYDVIYEALDDVVAAASGLLEPVVEEQVIGKAQVLQTFRSSRAGVVAGCRVVEGRLRPNAKIVVLRDGEVVYEGNLDSLRHFDNDVSEMIAPNECGVACSSYRGWEIGDEITASIEIEIERRVTMAGGAERVDGRR